MEALRVLSRGVDGTTLTIYKGLSDEFTKDCYFKKWNTVKRYELCNLGTLEENNDKKVVFESFESFDGTCRIVIM